MQTENAVRTLDLSGTWELSGGGVCLPAAMPGDQYSALHAAGLIPDPLIGLNETAVQPWREHVWSFRRDFDVPSSLLDCGEVHLQLESIDTVAVILLNGVEIAQSSNMFRPLCLPVRHHLHPGSNRLEVRIRPAHQEAASRAAAARLELGMDLAAPVSDNNRLPAMNMLRKVQCHAGWDWGPCLMVCGLYGQMRLLGVQRARIEHAFTVSRPENETDIDGPWIVDVSVRVHRAEAISPEPLTLRAELEETPGVTVEIPADSVDHHFTLRIPKPRLWYPAGQGEQALYRLRLTLYPVAACDLPAYLEQGGPCDDTLTRHLGLRTLEVIRRRDAIGESLTIAVNGREIFCKGANWIPCDALPARQTPDVYARLLGDAVAANMNMLRVWGGGQWESEDFYECCDRLGLLLWHDCMFACMHYPATGAFLADIREEIRGQILRLRDHPCIALWCGDNECAGTCAGGDAPAQAAAMENYHRFNTCVAQTVRAADPTRLFWPSSPSNGEGSLIGSWHDDTTGDMHYWAVWHGSKPFEAYRDVRPRFCSEFGFQSFPAAGTVARYTGGSEQKVDAPIMTLHQKQTGGNQRITRMFERYFHHPRSFGDFLYLSQVQQAMAIRTAVEYWRHSKPICMGTLYWQLNDNWPAASWSSIDYDGRWKQLHYHAARFYAPVAIALLGQELEARLSIVSDLPIPCRCRILVRWMTFEGGVLSRWHFILTLPPNAPATEAGRIPLQHLDPSAGFLVADLEADDLQGRHHRQRITHFLSAPKHCRLARAQVTMQHTADTITLSTDKPVFYLTVGTTDAPLLLSDNSITLLPGEQTTLHVQRGGPITPGRLTLQHLRQTYR